MRLFISYASKDRKLVTQLHNDLSQAGHKVWYDRAPEGLRPGDDWWAEILAEIEKCDVFIFALTPASVVSKACQAEFQYALNLNKPRFSIMLKTVELPSGSLLQKMHNVDARKYDRDAFVGITRGLNTMEVGIKEGAYPEQSASRPDFPFNEDKLAPYRDLKFENLAYRDQITAVFEVRDVLQTGRPPERAEARNLFLLWLKSPNITTSAEREIREALRGKRNVWITMGVVLAATLIAAAIFAPSLLNGGADPPAEEGRFASETGEAQEVAQITELVTAAVEASPVPATATDTPEASETASDTPEPTATDTPTPTNTPTPSETPEPTSTYTRTPTYTPRPSPTRRPTATATASEENSAVDESLGTGSNPITLLFITFSENVGEVQGAAEELANVLIELTGYSFEAEPANDFAEVIRAMCDGEAEIGALNTFSYLLANEEECAEVGVIGTRFGSPFYSGQIITRADSGIESMEDLEGWAFCRPDPLSISGWIIPSIAMMAAGVDLDSLEIIDAGGHDGVVTAVYNGGCLAGATFVDARLNVEEEFPDVMEKVVVLMESAPIPNDTLAYAPSLSTETKQAITDALVAIANDEGKRDLLEQVYGWSGLIPAEDAFYNDFRDELDAAGVSVEGLQ
jgi:phosphonate transport system substrate-binding protein